MQPGRIEYTPEPAHPDYIRGYEIGQRNAKCSGPNDLGWEFGSGMNSDVQYGLGHEQALLDANWEADPQFLNQCAQALMRQIYVR